MRFLIEYQVFDEMLVREMVLLCFDYNEVFVVCFRVSYRDGVMENEPKPCAAVKGTQIMVRAVVCLEIWELCFVCCVGKIECPRFLLKRRGLV